MTVAERMGRFVRRTTRIPEGYRRFLKFAVVGASGIPVNLGMVFIVTVVLSHENLAATVRDAIAFVAGIVVSVFTNFVLNDLWTWRDRRDRAVSGFWGRLVKFYLVSAVAAAVQFTTSMGIALAARRSAAWESQLQRADSWVSGIVHYFHALMWMSIYGEHRLYHVLAPCIGIALGMMINFFVNNVWTFRAKSSR